MKRTLSLLLTLIFVSSLLTACGTVPAVGTYTLETIGGNTPFDWIVGSLGSSEEAIEDLLGLFGTDKETLNEKFYVLTLENGGKASIYSEYAAMYDGSAESEGTWTLEGDVLTVTVNGEDTLMTFRDGVLTRDFNGDVGVFKKK